MLEGGGYYGGKLEWEREIGSAGGEVGEGFRNFTQGRKASPEEKRRDSCSLSWNPLIHKACFVIGKNLLYSITS